MLQFITSANERYSMAEQAQMAVEGGCQWVEMDFGANADPTWIREVSGEIVPLCREAGVMLTIRNYPEMAKEIGLHGVHLTSADSNAGATRQDLGAEAVIGARVGTASAVPVLEKLDIDYASLPSTMTETEAAALIADVRGAGCRLPIVIEGDYDATDSDLIKAIGASGVATGKRIMEAADPVEAVSQMIKALTGA